MTYGWLVVDPRKELFAPHIEWFRIIPEVSDVEYRLRTHLTRDTFLFVVHFHGFVEYQSQALTTIDGFYLSPIYVVRWLKCGVLSSNFPQDILGTPPPPP